MCNYVYVIHTITCHTHYHTHYYTHYHTHYHTHYYMPIHSIYTIHTLTQTLLTVNTHKHTTQHITSQHNTTQPQDVIAAVTVTTLASLFVAWLVYKLVTLVILILLGRVLLLSINILSRLTTIIGYALGETNKQTKTNTTTLHYTTVVEASPAKH